MKTQHEIKSSGYVAQMRRDYSLYVMQSRALPSVTDGLKAGGRRVLWMARDGKKYKSATLAGATMPIHPHASPEGAIDGLAAPYVNNIPLFKGMGAFGTMLKPTAYGASRYTSVQTTAFTDDVVFRDLEIIPMTENYDGTLMEPVHFLPLVPMALVNPSEGIALGFATNILPRALDDIIMAQLTHLKGGKKLSAPLPKFTPLNAVAVDTAQTERGIAYYFDGQLEIKNATTATIVALPYGQTHEKVISKLDDLIDSGALLDYTDRSRNAINIDLKFKRGILGSMDEKDLYKSLGLSVRQIENLNVLDFTGTTVWSTNPVDLIRAYTDWRLGWYVKRYQRLRDLLELDLERYYDIRKAITNNVSGVVRKIQSREELKDFLEAITVVNTNYIADLPVYRFTEEERVKNEERIAQALQQLNHYNDMLNSEQMRRDVYISELQEVLSKYVKGVYSK